MQQIGNLFGNCDKREINKKRSANCKQKTLLSFETRRLGSALLHPQLSVYRTSREKMCKSGMLGTALFVDGGDEKIL